MKKIAIIAGLALALAFGSVATAHAATTEGYTFIAPRFQIDWYSSQKTVNGWRTFGVQHRYSGGYPVRFVACNAMRQALGTAVIAYPGGPAAPTTTVWRNTTATPQTIVIRADSAIYNFVTLLCQGTWVWNY